MFFARCFISYFFICFCFFYKFVIGRTSFQLPRWNVKLRCWIFVWCSSSRSAFGWFQLINAIRKENLQNSCMFFIVEFHRNTSIEKVFELLDLKEWDDINESEKWKLKPKPECLLIWSYIFCTLKCLNVMQYGQQFYIKIISILVSVWDRWMYVKRFGYGYS